MTAIPPILRRHAPGFAAALCLLLFVTCGWAAEVNSVRVSEATLFDDMECFKIETPSATYLFGKRGAGFAGILDSKGCDWISHHHGGQALGEYRGLPKCGQPVKYFHCGYGFGQYANDNWFTSTITLREPAHIRIHCETAHGDAAGKWDFFPDHATFTLLKIPGNQYWFLYEGTPGGALDADGDFVIRPGGRKTPLTEPWKEVVPWVVFGAKESPHGLLMFNHQAGSPVDSYVSWPYKAGADGALNQMTVFGFGRCDWQDPKQHTPALTGLPAKLTIAMLPDTTEKTINAMVTQVSDHARSSTTLPAGFTEEVLATNLNAATAIAPTPDGRIFIADQTGKLLVWKDGRVLDSPALTLHVTDYWERGLIGVTLHPDFPHTPQIFVLYVTDRPFAHHVLSRFTMNGDIADPASETILLEGDDQAKLGGKQPAGHQGGPLRFGPDGKLYVALGEQTAREPSQRLDTLQGKILRLNPDGSIPEDNPFFATATGKYRAIWAYGMRNPFGMAFQPGTGRCFVTDVGESSWEEVDEIVKGGNYGWPLAEGKSTNPAFQNPIHTYPPVIGRCIAGGAFYSAHSFPEKWRGQFFFADWAAHWVKALDPAAPGNAVTFARGLNAPVAVEAAPDGSLLVLNRGTIWRDNKSWQPNTGSLVRIRYTGLAPELAARPPLARTLKALDVFASLDPLTPRSEFVEFTINAPPDQPGIVARRWIELPPGGHLGLTSQGEFEFPIGATVIQHYVVEKSGAPFETQVLNFTGARTCRAAAYRWSAEAKDSKLIEEGEIVVLPGDDKRHWFSPGAEENLNLDTVVTGFLLPLNERQINRDQQLEHWNERGWLTPHLRPEETATAPKLVAITDDSASLEARMRSYLDANCAACHHPGGPARGNFDARFLTPFPEQKLLDGELVASDLGIRGARVIVPGHPEKSILFQRLKRTDFFRMPPVSVNDEPPRILPLLEEWIRSLPVSPGGSN